MESHRRERGAKRGWIEDVLKHGDTEHEVVPFADAEVRYVLHQEAAAVGHTIRSRALPGLGNHGRAEIDARYQGAPRRQQAAPAAYPAANVQYAGSGAQPEPRLERQPLLELNGAIVELGHPVGAHRREALAFAREAPRSILPIRSWAV